jgi:hypothetical protein
VKNNVKAIFFSVITVVFLLSSYSVFAGDANVLGVKVDPLGERQYRIAVTLSHGDTGWDHYANAWLIFDENGEKIGERVLHHPHVNEQPFTRSLTLTIPETVRLITVKGQDSLHGTNGKMMVIELPPSP